MSAAYFWDECEKDDPGAQQVTVDSIPLPLLVVLKTTSGDLIHVAPDEGSDPEEVKSNFPLGRTFYLHKIFAA